MISYHICEYLQNVILHYADPQESSSHPANFITLGGALILIRAGLRKSLKCKTMNPFSKKKEKKKNFGAMSTKEHAENCSHAV